MAMEIISVTSGNNANFTHNTPTGLINSVLVVGVGTHQGNITGITYNGDSLTKIAEGSSAFDEDGSVWVLLNPDAGDNTVAITRSGGSWHGATAITLQGVKQTTTITNNKVDSASGSTASVTVVPPNTESFIICVMGSEADATGSSPTNATRIVQQGASYENSGVLYYFNNTGVPQTPSFTLSSGQRYGIVVMCLVEPDSSIGDDIPGTIYRKQGFQ